MYQVLRGGAPSVPSALFWVHQVYQVHFFGCTKCYVGVHQVYQVHFFGCTKCYVGVHQVYPKTCLISPTHARLQGQVRIYLTNPTTTNHDSVISTSSSRGSPAGASYQTPSGCRPARLPKDHRAGVSGPNSRPHDQWAQSNHRTAD